MQGDQKHTVSQGSGLDCGSEDPGSIPGIPSPRVGPLMARRFKDVCGRPGALVGVDRHAKDP